MSCVIHFFVIVTAKNFMRYTQTLVVSTEGPVSRFTCYEVPTLLHISISSQMFMMPLQGCSVFHLFFFLQMNEACVRPSVEVCVPLLCVNSIEFSVISVSKSVGFLVSFNVSISRNPYEGNQ